MSQAISGTIKVGEPLGDLRFRDYLKLARKRRWWIILTAGGMCLAAAVFALGLPDVYKSQTTILVDPQKVPDSYVTSTVTTTISDRLSTLTQQIMSPSLLRQTREELHLYPEIQGPDEAVIKRMAKSISIETLGVHQVNAFQVAFSDRDPEVAAKVANMLAADLIRANLKVRQEQFAGTADFLENELHDTKQQLEQKENQLSGIKSKYVMDLPESKQFHLEALSNLRLQLTASQDRVNRAQQEKIYLQSLMSSSHPTVDLDSGDGVRMSPESGQIQKLETRLSELRARYGPNFPDVRKAQAELDKFKAKAAAEDKDQPAMVQQPATTAGTVRNPVLEAQINKLDQEIKDQIKLQPELQKQIDFHASKLEHEPVFEQQISGLMRDYDTLRSHYDHLLDKKLSAEMASDLESHQRGESFVVLDRATPPLHPILPNRPLICVAGLVIGLLGGLALALALELTTDLVHDDQHAAQIYHAPVLAIVPYMLSPKQVRRSRARLLGASIGVAAAAVILGFVASIIFKGLV